MYKTIKGKLIKGTNILETRYKVRYPLNKYYHNNQEGFFFIKKEGNYWNILKLIPKSEVGSSEWCK